MLAAIQRNPTSNPETFMPHPFFMGASFEPSRAVDMDEEDVLIAHLQQGDGHAYEVLVRRYSAQMLAVARRLLRNEEDARDAVQEAFMNAFRALPRFRANAKLSTWLHRIVTNAALMKLRSANRRPEVSLEPLLPAFDEEGHHAEPVDLLPVTAEAALQSKETRGLVRACIEQLPIQYRTVLILRNIEELDTPEVAAILEITENAVKIRLHRARQALMTVLRKVLPETPYATKSIL
jgi:RNA polymerase sigma-70 factor (ECF subfamily)